MTIGRRPSCYFKTTVSVQSFPVEKIVIGQRPHRFSAIVGFVVTLIIWSDTKTAGLKRGFGNTLFKRESVCAHTHNGKKQMNQLSRGGIMT